jgi:hypothetical protein
METTTDRIVIALSYGFFFAVIAPVLLIACLLLAGTGSH